MKKKKRTYIYETHDTPFGSYTLRFKEKGWNILNTRCLAFLNSMNKNSDDLAYYQIKAGNGSFEAIPNGRRMLEHIEIVEKKEYESEMVAKPASMFLDILDKLDNPLKDGSFYNEERKRGVIMFNGTPIAMHYSTEFWQFVWSGERDYSLGVLKEFLTEVENGMDLGDFRLEWEFDKDCRSCKIFFVKK